MRIKEVYIARYGPFREFGPLPFDGFTLIFGENESGKTLLLDAIIRFLLTRSRDQGLFSRVDRVKQNPKGYVELETSDGIIRLPDDTNLSDLLGIHPHDLRSVFIVRASDLGVPKESEYYAEVTDRLAGIHREPILRIRRQLRQIGCLTNEVSTGRLSDAAEFGKLQSRVEDGKRLLSQIGDLLQRSEDQQLLALEGELLETQERIGNLKQELVALEAAEKRDHYRRGSALLEQLGQNAVALAGLAEVSDGDLEQWRDSQRDLEQAERAADERGETLAPQQDAVEALERKLRGAETAFGAASRREEAMRRLRAEVDDQIRRVEQSRARVPLRGTLGYLGIGLFVLMVTSLAGLIFAELPGLFGALAVAAGLGVLAVVFWLILDRRSLGEIERHWVSLRLEAAGQGFHGNTLETLSEALGNFDRERQVLDLQRQAADRDLQVARTKVEAIQQNIDQLTVRIEEAREAVRILQSRTGLISIEELRESLERKRRLERNQDQTDVMLAEGFGEAKGGTEEKLNTWGSRVASLAGFSNSAPGVEYDKAREEAVRTTLGNLQPRVTEIDEKLRVLRHVIRDLALEASRVLLTDASLPGDTVHDVEVIRDHVNRFIADVEENARIALLAISLCEAIEEEEAAKVGELFGSGDNASECLAEITEGAYTQVAYDVDERELSVLRSDGETLRAYQLSSGTYDQLYLATRLSLARHILGDGRGFFLFDDPFLTSDTKRLAKQLDLLLKLSREGWQIVYFSVKEEVRRALKAAVTRGEVQIHRLESLLPA